jgi:hypothetical protein
MKRSHCLGGCWQVCVAMVGVSMLSGVCGESLILPTEVIAAEQLPASAAEVDVEKTANDAIAEALKGIKAGNGPAANKDKDVVSVPIPDNATKVTQTSPNVLQIKFPAGKGEAAATIVRDQLRAANWDAGIAAR